MSEFYHHRSNGSFHCYFESPMMLLACGAAGDSAGADGFAVWADGNASASGSVLTDLSRANV